MSIEPTKSYYQLSTTSGYNKLTIPFYTVDQSDSTSVGASHVHFFGIYPAMQIPW